MKNIYIIGSGKIAYNIASSLNENQINITGVYGRNIETGNKLAKKVNSKFYKELKIPKITDLIIICVPDDQIKIIAKKINKIATVHTSGSSDIKLLKNCSKYYGVVWPIQTFTNNKKANFKKIPICIEANNDKFKYDLNKLFTKISNNVINFNFKQRKLIHLSAVFSSNFSNYLYSISEELLSEQKIDFIILKSLILETTNNAFKYKPTNNQTGPAIRKDLGTIKKHLNLLSKKKKNKYAKIYSLISEYIMENDDEL